jgi:hypothetical protein
MIFDDGQGFDYPILINVNLCIFDIGDKYIVKKKGQGIIEEMEKPKDEDEFIKRAIKQGWRKVDI